MRKILWDTVKKRAAADFSCPFIAETTVERTAPYALLMTLENHRPWRANMSALLEAGRRTIMQWDIRRAATLRELFPQCMPGGEFSCGYDGRGRWVLLFEDKKKGKD